MDKCLVCWLPINEFQKYQFDGLCPECHKYENATIQNRMNDDLQCVEATDQFFEQVLQEVSK